MLETVFVFFFSLYAPYVHLCCTFAHIQAQDTKENFASAELWAQTAWSSLSMDDLTLKHRLLRNLVFPDKSNRTSIQQIIFL